VVIVDEVQFGQFERAAKEYGQEVGEWLRRLGAAEIAPPIPGFRGHGTTEHKINMWPEDDPGVQIRQFEEGEENPGYEVKILPSDHIVLPRQEAIDRAVDIVNAIPGLMRGIPERRPHDPNDPHNSTPGLPYPSDGCDDGITDWKEKIRDDFGNRALTKICAESPDLSWEQMYKVLYDQKNAKKGSAPKHPRSPNAVQVQSRIGLSPRADL
jgi:hypothetical protein